MRNFDRIDIVLIVLISISLLVIIIGTLWFLLTFIENKQIKTKGKSTLSDNLSSSNKFKDNKQINKTSSSKKKKTPPKKNNSKRSSGYVSPNKRKKQKKTNGKKKK